MVGEAKKGALHGPVLLWRSPTQLPTTHLDIPRYLGDKHIGKQGHHHPEKGKVEFPNDVMEEDESEGGRPQENEEDGEGDGRVLFAGHFEEGRPKGWLWAASPSSNADHGLLQFRKEVLILGQCRDGVKLALGYFLNHAFIQNQ